MKKVQNDSNKELELQIREQIKAYCVINADKFDPYSVSKVLRYLFAYNDGSESAIKAYEALGLRFFTNLIERKESMKEMILDDPLIDIDIKDIVDIVRVYSVYAKPEKQLFVPQLFFDDSNDQST